MTSDKVTTTILWKVMAEGGQIRKDNTTLTGLQNTLNKTTNQVFFLKSITSKKIGLFTF